MSHMEVSLYQYENVGEYLILQDPYTYYVQVLTNMGHVLEAAGVSFKHGNYYVLKYTAMF